MTCHVPPDSKGLLPALLGRNAKLKVKNAEEGERLRSGCVYVAPPDRHLAITPNGRCELSRSAYVNFTRPAADVLFASASGFASGALGVVLTGYLYDGAAGAAAIRAAGGIVLAQEPTTSVASGMPSAAIDNGAANLVLPLESLPSALVTLVSVPGARELFGLPRAS